MSDASLNDIYKLVGELTGTVRAMNGKVDDLKRDASEAEATSAAYRQGVRDELGKIVMRTTHLESDLASVKKKVDAQGEVTADVLALRERAIGAGTVGGWLVKLGIGVVAFAGWVLGIYTYLTGKPPP